ncbi:MAG TPA: hypothetical protein VHO06_17035 [Polyangia bacterium]|nr:hypothetical protein [Polyangia bacterium]
MAEVVEANLPHLANREELEVALRTPTKVPVGRGLAVSASVATALMDVARHQAGPAHRSAEDLLQLRVPRDHAAVLGREDQLRGGRGERALQVDEKLGVDRDGVDAAALRDVAVV